MRTTITEAARMVKRPVTTVRDAIRRAGTPTTRFGNYRLVDPRDVEAVMRTRETLIPFGETE
jgi:hypothetical protein